MCRHFKNFYFQPDNILAISTSGNFTQNFDFKLADFGLATFLAADENGDHFARGKCGTPRYLAPEQGKGRKYSFGADIFSLGCVCVFYANQGRHLFKNQDEIENWGGGVMEEVLDSDQNSADLVDLVGKMVRLEQKERPSAKEILEQCTDARKSCSNPKGPDVLPSKRSLTFPDSKGPELPSVRGLSFLDSREFVPRPKETSETLHNEPRKSLSNPKKKRKFEEENEEDSEGGKPEKKVADRKEIGDKENEEVEEGEKKEENAKQRSLENRAKKKKEEEKIEKEKRKVEVEKEQKEEKVEKKKVEAEKKVEVEERENDDKFRRRLEELADKALLNPTEALAELTRRREKNLDDSLDDLLEDD